MPAACINFAWCIATQAIIAIGVIDRLIVRDRGRVKFERKYQRWQHLDIGKKAPQDWFLFEWISCVRYGATRWRYFVALFGYLTNIPLPESFFLQKRTHLL